MYENEWEKLTNLKICDKINNNKKEKKGYDERTIKKCNSSFTGW